MLTPGGRETGDGEVGRGVVVGANTGLLVRWPPLTVGGGGGDGIPALDVTEGLEDDWVVTEDIPLGLVGD